MCMDVTMIGHIAKPYESSSLPEVIFPFLKVVECVLRPSQNVEGEVHFQPPPTSK